SPAAWSPATTADQASARAGPTSRDGSGRSRQVLLTTQDREPLHVLRPGEAGIDADQGQKLQGTAGGGSGVHLVVAVEQEVGQSPVGVIVAAVEAMHRGLADVERARRDRRRPVTTPEAVAEHLGPGLVIPGRR